MVYCGKGIIYGVDLDSSVTPEQVRDAIVSCFIDAHHEQLEDLKNYGDITEKEFESIKKLNIEALARQFMKDVGGDFSRPNKESLVKLVEKLAEYAANFRSQEIIVKHKEAIEKLLCKLG